MKFISKNQDVVIGLVFVLSIYSCQSNQKTEATLTDQNKNVKDSAFIQNFIFGLWSLDSNQSLTNVGYYFQPNGIIDFVGADQSGEWRLIGSDQLEINYQSNEETNHKVFHLDSLSESQMILSDSNKIFVYRKVPFGIELHENVLSGFHGSIESGQQKQYSFPISSAKKIRLTLISKDENIKMRVYDDKKELTLLPLKDFQSIMVRSGNYKIVVSKYFSKNNAMEDFDVKVLGW